MIYTTMDIDEAGKWQQKSLCSRCVDAGRSHEVVEVPAGMTDRRSCWGEGVPTHFMRCTSCGDKSGPWVSASIVGGCW